MQRRRLLAIGLLALASAVVGGSLFRRQTYDNPELGVITYHYRWGKRAKLTADTNRDGKIDVRARIDDLGSPAEYWEDSDHDGSFDRHVIMEGSEIQRVEDRLCSRQTMTELSDRITVDPEQCGGRPCIRGMRIRVMDVLDLLANGLTVDEVLEELPDLEREDIQATLKFASRRLVDHPVFAG